MITGLGPVTSIGCGRERLWSGLLAGRDGSAEIRGFDTARFAVHRACEVQDAAVAPDRSGGLPIDAVGRTSRLAIAAAALALEDAGLRAPIPAAGVVIGTASGDPDEAGDAARGARWIPRRSCHVVAATVARAIGARGAAWVVPNACAAGNYALAVALHWIHCGVAEVVMTGGADVLSPLAITGFARLGALAPDCCRPFDRHRKGMVLGEGAGLLVIESERHARRRDARVYAELAGAGFSCDALALATQHPSGAGARLAILRALREAEVPADHIDYVSAHGVGTGTSDRMEAAALRSVLASRARSVPVSSIKSMIGHTMGAAGALDAIACALAIETGCIPPTIHFETLDPDCDLDVVPNDARSHLVRFAMSNAFGLGGTNSCVVLSRPLW